MRTTNLGTLAITGAAGRVGAVLRAALRDDVSRLLLLDQVQLHSEDEKEEPLCVDLRDGAAVERALTAADAVLHLAGLADEAPLRELLRTNVLGTHHVLEAARRLGIGRVVLASSNRLTGFYPVSRVIDAAVPPRPDGLYGVSKAAMEALGRLYADKFGIGVVCLRIGSFEARPAEPRHLATWLSHRDAIGFVRAALSAPLPDGFAAVYAASANARGFWDLDAGAAALGYQPVDDAQVFAPELSAAADQWDPRTPQGGRYADADYTLAHLPHP